MTKKSLQAIALDFVQTKTEKTFAVLMNRLKPGLFSYVYNFIKDKEATQDILSKTFIAIWEKSNQYNDKYNFSTWAYAIAKNESLHYIRESNKTVSREMLAENHSKILKLNSPVDNINIELIDGDDDNVMNLYNETIKVIHSLDEPYRTVMIEREINQKKLQDIASDLDWNLSTVKTRLRKAKVDVANKIKKNNKSLLNSYYDEIYN